MKRGSGVLMHISSLPGEYSVGSFGKEARDFVDFLFESGFSYWQVLPFCMADDCNSPYKSYSAFGANPYFIDLPILHQQGLLTAEELEGAKQHSPYLCEFDRLAIERPVLLRRAALRFAKDGLAMEKLESFLAEYSELSLAARFLALREVNDEKPWQEWTVEEPKAEDLLYWQFVQYEFFTQWQDVKAYANERGISIIGDIPIYVSTDSCDVWANPDQFLLDARHQPTAVAGVPPDYFSEEGQLWNNPLYDWKAMKKDGYAWWSRRMSYMLTLFDGVRIDHFRGLESYWSVPAGAKSAKEGKWVKGPGRAFVDTMKQIAGELLIIAEDLGDITPAVDALVRYSGFPGMRVIQFAFLGDPATPHLPHHYVNNCVAYSGTHDNTTLLAYVWEVDPATRRRIFDYCGYNGDDFAEGCVQLIRTLLASAAGVVILPIQDLLIYGSDTRMNKPGSADGNWRYRVTADQLRLPDRARLAYWNNLYGRQK